MPYAAGSPRSPATPAERGRRRNSERPVARCRACWRRSARRPSAVFGRLAHLDDRQLGRSVRVRLRRAPPGRFGHDARPDRVPELDSEHRLRRTRRRARRSVRPPHAAAGLPVAEPGCWRSCLALTWATDTLTVGLLAGAGRRGRDARHAELPAVPGDDRDDRAAPRSRERGRDQQPVSPGRPLRRAGDRGVPAGGGRADLGLRRQRGQLRRRARSARDAPPLPAGEEDRRRDHAGPSARSCATSSASAASAR